MRPPSGPATFVRAGWRAWAIIVLLLVLVPAGCWISRAEAAIPKLTPEGCALAADMALVARGLSQGGVAREKGERVMDLIYANVAHPIAIELRRSLTALAYRSRDAPIDLAAILVRVCNASGGDLGPVLGVGV